MDRRYKVNKAIKRKDREREQNQALNKTTRPVSLEALEALKDDGQLTLQTFKDNIAKLWPLVLLMVSEGHTISHIEEFMGLRARSLTSYLNRMPRLYKSVRDARQLNLDKKKELSFLLS